MTPNMLVARLQQVGELPSEFPANPAVYEGTLVDAVRHFQTLHGITPTGSIDAGTWKQLSTPFAQRIRQLSLTLERWRWVPHSFSEPPLVVNIPEFRLRAYDQSGRVTLSMPVIVGAAHRKTPVLQADLIQVVFHPFWDVPKDIQEREIAPHAALDAGYLGSHDYQVLDRSGKVVETIDSTALNEIANGALRVRQMPGIQNALGAIKFVFPNVFNVYMHGTPQEALFQRSRRDFSHGCIRVESPEALAAWVLRREPGWPQARIAEELANPITYTVTLSHPIPVLIVYGTGIAAEDGSVRFFDDIYGYDQQLEHRLDALSRARARGDHRP